MKPRKNAGSTGAESEDVRAIPGLPLVSEKAAIVLGLKLAGVWTPGHRRTMAGQWGCTPEAVDQVSEKVDAVLVRIVGDDPTRRLVIHQHYQTSPFSALDAPGNFFGWKWFL